jgi:hypothetical protein
MRCDRRKAASAFARPVFFFASARARLVCARESIPKLQPDWQDAQSQRTSRRCAEPRSNKTASHNLLNGKAATKLPRRTLVHLGELCSARIADRGTQADPVLAAAAFNGWTPHHEPNRRSVRVRRMN